MRRPFSRTIPALLALTLIAVQCPAWATPNATGADRTHATAKTPELTSDTRSRSAGTVELSEEQRRQLAERERENGAMENYEGGVVIEVGAGVIILVLVLIIVFVD